MHATESPPFMHAEQDFPNSHISRFSGLWRILDQDLHQEGQLGQIANYCHVP